MEFGLAYYSLNNYVYFVFTTLYCIMSTVNYIGFYCTLMCSYFFTIICIVTLHNIGLVIM